MLLGLLSIVSSPLQPSLPPATTTGEGGGSDLFDVIIPSRTWRIQDRVSAARAQCSAAPSFYPVLVVLP